MKNKERPIFKYDSRLKASELRLFEDLIGKSIAAFRIENTTVLLSPNFRISNLGKCYINFYSKQVGQYATIELTSLFQETPPVLDSGGIALRKAYENYIPNSETLVVYPEESAVESFKFYGSKERRTLQEIDPELDIESLNRWGFNDFPEVEVDTIEFMVIEHESKKKTIVSTDSGGFWFNFLIDRPIDDELCYDSYMKVNGYEKNIVLHHEIKKGTD